MHHHALADVVGCVASECSLKQSEDWTCFPLVARSRRVHSTEVKAAASMWHVVGAFDSHSNTCFPVRIAFEGNLTCSVELLRLTKSLSCIPCWVWYLLHAHYSGAFPSLHLPVPAMSAASAFVR